MIRFNIQKYAKGAQLLCIAILLGLAAGVSGQVPAQSPLLSSTGGGVSPNFMLTMDDSGSMMFQHMPEESVVAGAFSVTHPIGSNSVRMDPGDNAILASFFVGTVASVQGSTNWRQKILRSPDTNTIYYNPEIRYQPWAVSTYPLPAATATAPAGRRNNSPVAAAYLDPMNPATGGTVNLTNVRNVNTRWCFSANATTDCQDSSSSSNISYDPGLYYRLNKVAGAFQDPSLSGSYTRYSINSIGIAPYVPYPTKAAARSDCAGLLCTQAEERQNYANWFTYYRTRNHLARGAMQEAFAAVAANASIRVGFGRINKVPSSSTDLVDGVSTNVIEGNATAIYGGGGVRQFSQTRKNQLFSWLAALPASGGTPLPAALDAVGKYYQRGDARGPYTDDPSLSSNVVGDNKTCRRSYQLMVTDGYWNGALTVGNQDTDPGPGHTFGSNTYTFPGNTRPYMDGSVNTLADVAMKYWKNDLQPLMDNKVKTTSNDPSFWQNMTNYMVGLGVKGNRDPATDLPALVSGSANWGDPSTSLPAKIDDLWHAALNSRGAYYSAKDPATLAAAVAGALSGAQGGVGATAGVATVATTLQDGNRKYVPKFEPNVWSGDIEATPLDIRGQSSATVWKASQRLPLHGARNIVTWDTAPLANPSTPSAVDFTWGSLSLANQLAMSTFSTVPTTHTAGFVDFLRGNHSMEGLAQPFRSRLNSDQTPFVLGDFVNSNPVLIKGNFDGGYGGLNLGAATGYQTFTAAKAARAAVLFVGGNDGMLHAFKDGNSIATAGTDGVELFAYVPRAVYPNLYKLSDKNYGGTVPHQYFVDGPQNEGDAFVKGPGATPGTLAATASWRNYLLGSLGAGGRAIYALDVTSSPTLGAQNVRWEISSATDGDIGYILSPVEVGVLPNGQWVAIFGNGFSSANGYATLFIVDLQTAAIRKLNVDTAGGNGLGGVGVVRGANGVINNLYAGDLKGNLWKFDYTTGSTPFATSGGTAPFTVNGGTTPLFKATAPGSTVPSPITQPITQPPSIFNHTDGGNIVVFGTGKLFASGDESDTTVQTIYGIWDKPADTVVRPLTRDSLPSRIQPRTLSALTGTATGSTFYTLTGSDMTWATERGWSVDIPASLIPGGRIIYPTQIFASNLVLATVVGPAPSVAVCSSNNWVGADLVFDVQTGKSSDYRVFDTNGSLAVDTTDQLAAGILTDSVGRRAIVTGIGTGGGGSGPPICQPGFHPQSIQTATGQTMTCVKDPTLSSGSSRVFDRVWRRIINPPIR